MKFEAPKVKRISPMLAVADMDLTLQFYTRVLGFNVVMSSPAYSIMERDDATVHFMKAADEAVMNAVRGHTEIYVEVENIAPYWEHVSQFRNEYRIRDLSIREYGMREFQISDPNGCLVFVGERT
jgi:catechol 2,3-dioxygenase-like lactoylglutathione lyase family enzyme